MPVQKDIEEGIFQTTLSNVENNSTSDNVDTINNIEAIIESSTSSFPTVTTPTSSNDGIVSHTLAPPPPEDTDQSAFTANLNTSHGHTETEPGYRIDNK